jgi:hypothetical protein
MAVDSASTKPIDVPLKTTVNKEDGVIDVEVPFEDFGSPLLSPPLPGDNSGSSFGGSSFGQNSFLCTNNARAEHPLNVAGWLDCVHPDFTLQAVRPGDSNIDDLKAAMSAEPSPPLNNLPSGNDSGEIEKWVDVSTSLVADTTTWTVQRIRLRRLVRYTRQHAMPLVTPSIHIVPGSRSQYGNPYAQSNLAGGATASLTAITLEESFVFERIMDMDGLFVDVLERILATSTSHANTSPTKGPTSAASNSNATSKAHSNSSTSSSRSNSQRGRPQQVPTEETILLAAEVDVPRDYRRIISATLEQIVAGVAHERLNARAEPSRLRTLGTDAESTLREGISRWFDEVEARAGTEAPSLDKKDGGGNATKNASSATVVMAVPVIPNTENGQRGDDTERTPRPTDLRAELAS